MLSRYKTQRVMPALCLFLGLKYWDIIDETVLFVYNFNRYS